MLVLPVNVVRSFPSFIRPIKKTSVFWIPQQKLTDPSVSSSYCDVDCSVSSLWKNKMLSYITINRSYDLSFWLLEMEETVGKREML